MRRHCRQPIVPVLCLAVASGDARTQITGGRNIHDEDPIESVNLAGDPRVRNRIRDLARLLECTVGPRCDP